MGEELVERNGLLQMIPPNIQPLKVLVIESLFYLSGLRDIMPNAHISVVTSFTEAAETRECGNLNVEWHFMDFRAEQLPFADGTFDLVLAEPCLTMAYTPYETLAGIGKSLKDTGYLVTEFRNIRYWRVLETLREGFFHEREERLYAKPEIVRLLNDAIFKEISFAPFRQDDRGAEKDWEALGFENFSHDLATEVWMVKAGRSTETAANLKSLFTARIRQELAWILHRIEYDIDREENLERLWAFCRENMIFEDYLGDLAREIIVHPEALELLCRAAQEQGLELE